MEGNNDVNEEQVPLDSSPPVTDVKTRGHQTGLYFSKRRLILLAIVCVILLLLVIVFAVLYGIANNQTPEDVERKEAHLEGPTDQVPTTRGTQAWWNVRLPRDVIPYHYNVDLDVSLEKMRFSGAVEIFVKVNRATNVILVHCNKMDITSAVVTRYGSRRMPIERQFWFENNQFYVIQLKSNFEPGSGDIKLWFKAFVANDLVGLYRGDYKTPTGETVNYIASQLQATDARKVFPCFDEPAFKATFRVTVLHDRPDYIAISNMPVKSTRDQGGKKRTEFQKTPKMSTYLLAFAICDFGNRTVVTENKVKMSFYAAPHQIPHLEYAPRLASKVLTFYTKYFGIEYPLPKADMMALPDFSFGAMENWGLVMYREVGLLWTQAASSDTNKQYTGMIVAHELAHQWFGNLVTMKWWGDLWLNEGFASYVWYLGLASVETDWKLPDQFIVDTLTKALTLDGLASSHPIKIAVNHPDQIGEIFDSISYDKGASILRMLEDFLGTATFVSGVKRYLTKHAYGVAETDDLWSALKEESCSRGSCVDVKQLMDTWTLQMGYPVVTLKQHNGTHYTSSQARFLFDTKANVSASKFISPFDYKWVVPFTYVTNAEPTKKQAIKLESEVPIAWDGRGWVKGNYLHKGYYLVNYEDNNWDALAVQLKANHTVFSAADRAGMIKDAFYLARAGLLGYDKAFSLTEYMQNETEYVPWKALAGSVGYIERKLSMTRPACKNLQKYLVHLSKNMYNTLGFVDMGTHMDKMKRDVILETNCMANVASCVNTAKEKYRAWMKDPLRNSIPPNFHRLVYYYGIANGGEEDWDFAFSQFQKTKEATVKAALLYGMSGAKEAWLVRRYLDYSLDPTKIKSQDTSSVIRDVADQNPLGAQLVWDFVVSRWQDIMDRFGSSIFTMGRVILTVTDGFSNDYQLKQLTEFAAKNTNAGTGTQALKQAIERVRANVDWVKDNEKEVADWLSKYVTENKL